MVSKAARFERAKAIGAASFFLLVFAASTTAIAGWEVIYLHPTGIYSSEARAVSGARQAGYVAVNANEWHAALWSGTAESWVDLHPDGYSASYIYDMSGEQQAGYAIVDGRWPWDSHAGTWSGAAVVNGSNNGGERQFHTPLTNGGV